MKDRLRWLTKYLENEPLANITRQKIERLMATRTGSDATRNRYVAEVSKILSHAQTLGWLVAVPKMRRY
jgi:phage baseplate assembly protein W